MLTAPWQTPVDYSCLRSSGVSRIETQLSFSALAEARAAPGSGCNWQPMGPARRNDHQLGEFLSATEAGRHFADDLIVHMQHDGIAGALDADERCGEQIPADGADDILGPQAPISAVAAAAIAPLARGGVLEDDDFVLEVFDLNAWKRIGELSPGRQLDEQKHAGAFQHQPAAVDHLLALAHRPPRGTIDRVPELLDLRMGSAPL